MCPSIHEEITVMTLSTATEASPEVTSFLSRPIQNAVIGGRDVAAADGATFKTLDPGSGDALAEVVSMKERDVDLAVQAATKAFPDWSALPVNDRAIWVHRLADAIEKRKATIAQIEALDAGKLRLQAEGDVQNCVDTLRYFNNMALHIQRRSALAVSGHEAWTVRQAWGPCGFIVPW